MSKLPIKRIVNVAVNLAPAGAQAQSISDLLVLGTSAIIDPVERMRTYDSLSSVAADFGTSVEEYKAAQAWFGQSPQPTQIRIGRWVNAASKGGLQCGSLSASQQDMSLWTAITTGAFKVAVDGAGAADITGLDFSGETNLNGVAAVIDAALSGGACVWNAVYSRFEFTSATTGASSSISFLQAPGSGVDISAMLMGRSTNGGYTYDGLAAESALDAVNIFDDRFGQMWYGLVIPSADAAATKAVAPAIEAFTNKHVFGVNIQDSAVLNPSSTTDLAYELKALNVMRTITQYSSTSAYAICSALARILTTDYAQANSVITLKFKREPGITAETLSATQANAAEAKDCNLFVAYDNDTVIIEQGVMSNGEFADVVMGTDWLALAIQTGVYNVLYTSTTKIPQTDAGTQIIVTAIEGICAQGVLNGLLAPGVWQSDGFGTLKEGDYLQKGYYVWVLPIASQNPTDRAARKSPPIKVAAKLAGAIHSVDVSVVVNR